MKQQKQTQDEHKLKDCNVMLAKEMWNYCPNFCIPIEEIKKKKGKYQK